MKVMQLKKLAQAMLVVASMLAIAGCTHTKKNMNPNEGSSYEDPYDRAQASGAGSGSNYDDGVVGSKSKQASSKDVYYFDFDRSVVKPQDKPAIYAKADYLLSHPKATIILEGHTDPRGSREYNVGLGERRANAIADMLKAKGVNPSQIRMLSYGAERAVQGHTEEDYQKDRRAIFAHIQQG
jgi:peptidoglycan-associated lipoprotein